MVLDNKTVSCCKGLHVCEHVKKFTHSIFFLDSRNVTCEQVLIISVAIPIFPPTGSGGGRGGLLVSDDLC